jgi:hypothetical protein
MQSLMRRVDETITGAIFAPVLIPYAQKTSHF